ncbi:MAG: hypothetical protein Q4F15_03735 [Bacillota bacterium]|nr:hypothetical protein [Bacillota bacterium]
MWILADEAANDFSIGMALCDYIPVILYGCAAFLLLRDLHNKAGRVAYSLMAAGFIFNVLAGFCKATWKLLYAANICDFSPLNEMFFPVQSFAFLLAGAGALALIITGRKKPMVAASFLAPVVWSGTMLFVAFMCIGLGLLDAGLIFVCVMMKRKRYIPLFVVSFVFCLGMGYLSSQDFSEAYWNWIAEGVNIIGCGALFVGALLLHKDGLADFKMDGSQPPKEAKAE